MPEGRLGIRRLLLALLLPGVLALLAVDAWNDYRALARVVVDAHDQILIEPAQALDDSVSFDPDGDVSVKESFSVASMFEAVRARHKHLHVGIARVAASGGSPAGAPEETLLGVDDLPPPPRWQEGVPIFYDADYRGYRVRIAALQRTLTVAPARSYRLLVQAAESTDAREGVLRDAWHMALRNDALLVAAMVALVWLGVALALRPLRRLRGTLAARRPGDLAPLDTRGIAREVAPLVDAMNHHMASQRRLLADQVQFLADASHQLRTPLAIMLTQAGYALRESDPAVQRDTLRAIAAQLERTRRLGDQLLALAHAQDAAATDDRDTPCDLNTIARNVVLQYLPLAHEKGQDLGWVDGRGSAFDDDADDLADARFDEEAEGPRSATGAASAAPVMVAPVAGSTVELHEALANLVHNAIKYTPAGGHITVALHSDADSVCVDVSDTGAGIAPELRQAVFERFHRHAPAANVTGAPSPGGAGLGLAIARAFARRHGGEIELGDAEAQGGRPGGLRARLRLPLLAQGAARPVNQNAGR